MNDMNKTTSANDLINTTIIEGLANNVTPINQTLTEVTIFYTQIQSNTLKNFLFSSRSRIRLLKGHRETFKECLIKNISADETTIIRTLAFSIGSSNHIKSRRRFYKLTNLLQKHSLAFKNRLQAENFIGCEIDLIKQ